MPYFLAFDSSQTEGSVALAHNEKIMTAYSWFSQKSHSALLLGYIQESLKLLPNSYQSLDALALFKGPGSSTGLRISAAVAKGLNFYDEKPLYLFSIEEIEESKKKYKLEFESLSLLLVKMAYDAFINSSPTCHSDDFIPEYFLKNL